MSNINNLTSSFNPNSISSDLGNVNDTLAPPPSSVRIAGAILQQDYLHYQADPTSSSQSTVSNDYTRYTNAVKLAEQNGASPNLGSTGVAIQKLRQDLEQGISANSAMPTSGSGSGAATVSNDFLKLVEDVAGKGTSQQKVQSDAQALETAASANGDSNISAVAYNINQSLNNNTYSQNGSEEALKDAGLPQLDGSLSTSITAGHILNGVLHTQS
jgi:hypothetical protein